METLGLSSERQPSDNMFQRLFWPTIREQEDVDLIGYQSFWLCFALAILNLIGIFSGGSYAVLAVVVALLYLGGACGVRQRSVTAACIMFALYLLNTVQVLILAPGLGVFMFVRFVLLALLAANVRATILAADWGSRAASTIDMAEMRAATTFADRLANQMPPTVWPRVKWFFIPLGSIAIVAMLVINFTLVLLHRQQTPVQPAPTAATYTVDPQN